MVAEGTSALVTAFPAREGHSGARRLLELLTSLGDEGGCWTGEQQHLARVLQVDPRTIRRWMQQLRAAALVDTSGRGTELTYIVMARPAGWSSRATVVSIEDRRNPGHSPSVTPDMTPDRWIRGTAPTPDIQIQPRAGASPSSSLSSDPGHVLTSPTPDTPAEESGGDPIQNNTPDIRGGGGGDGLDGDFDLTPAGEVAALFGCQVSDEMARFWADMTPRARALALEKRSECPPTKNPAHPSPDWVWPVLRTGVSLDQAERLAERYVRRSAPPAAPHVSGPVAAPAASMSAPRRPESLPVRVPWWSTFVVPAVALGIGYLIARGGHR